MSFLDAQKDGAVRVEDNKVDEILYDMATYAEHMRKNTVEYLAKLGEDAGKGITPVATTGFGELCATAYDRTYAKFTVAEGLAVPTAVITTGEPNLDTISNVEFDDVADIGPYPGEEYTPLFAAPPLIDTIQDPGDWSGDTDVNVPTKAALPDVSDPNLAGIVVPVIPQLDISAFTAEAPIFNVREVDGTFNFTEVEYTSDVLTQADALIQQMLAGGVGIPDIVWNQIWARATVQTDDAAEKLVNEINKDWAARGFSLPQGVQAAQVLQARSEAFNKRSELARDNAIQYSQEEIKNLQFAVQQGIAFESLRGGWHEQEMQRSFEAAKFVIESQIQLLNADIAIVNAQMQLYSTEAQVYKTLVEAEVSKLDKYRLDIQAQGLVNESNKSLIQLYGARISELKLSIDDYNSRVQAAGVEADVIKTQVQVYSEEIKAFVARTQALSNEVNMYKTTVEAEGIKVGAYETSVKAYSQEVQAFSSRIGASAAKVNAETEIEKLKLAEYDSSIKGYASELDAKAKVYNAEVNLYDSQIKGLLGLAEDNRYVTKAMIDSDKNKIQFMSEQGKLQIADAQLSARAAEATAKLAIDTNESIAEITANLTGSIYSAINVGASESISMSGNISESTSYNGGDI